MPVFDGLFPGKHNSIVQDLLFIVAHWHGIAKLHMHTDPTLDIFHHLTPTLGDQLRLFSVTTCAEYDTYELPREAAARRRRKAGKSSGDTNGPATTTRRRKPFNMDTYKLHSLGDYEETIRNLGTCDSYSTEPVCEKLEFHVMLFIIFPGRTRTSHT